MPGPEKNIELQSMFLEWGGDPVGWQIKVSFPPDERPRQIVGVVRKLRQFDLIAHSKQSEPPEAEVPQSRSKSGNPGIARQGRTKSATSVRWGKWQ